MDNDTLAESFKNLEGDLSELRRLTCLAMRLYLELGEVTEESEQLSALMSAVRSKAMELEQTWKEGWIAAGGRQ